MILALPETSGQQDNTELVRSLDEAYRDGLTDEEREQLHAAAASFRRLLEQEDAAR
jgi:hypothetical protein